MSVELWDGQGAVLADTSAWMHELLLTAIGRGDLAWCWPVRYELLIDARGPEDSMQESAS